MSVYTVVERSELEGFLAHYSHSRLIEFAGISAGIENTNYFVTTEQGEYVLTLFEQHTADELDYFLDLMAYLAEHGVPSAHPLADREGHYLRMLKGKPAALVQRLPGRSVDHPTAAHCLSLGRELGRIHRVGQGFPEHRANTRGPHWWARTARTLEPLLEPADRRLLEEELRFLLCLRRPVALRSGDHRQRLVRHGGWGARRGTAGGIAGWVSGAAPLPSRRVGGVAGDGACGGAALLAIPAQRPAFSPRRRDHSQQGSRCLPADSRFPCRQSPSPAPNR